MFSAAFIGTISSHLWSQQTQIIMMLTSFIYCGGSHRYGQIRDSLRFWCEQGFLRWSGAIGITCDCLSFNQLLHILCLTPTSPFVFGSKVFSSSITLIESACSSGFYSHLHLLITEGPVCFEPFVILCRALLASQPAIPPVLLQVLDVETEISFSNLNKTVRSATLTLDRDVSVLIPWRRNSIWHGSKREQTVCKRYKTR